MFHDIPIDIWKSGKTTFNIKVTIKISYRINKHIFKKKKFPRELYYIWNKLENCIGIITFET